MKHLDGRDIPESIETWRVISAWQSEPNYSEDKMLLVDLGENDGGYVIDHRYVLIEMGHCSCYDWPDADPCATEYGEDELVALAKSKLDGSGCYYKSEPLFWRSVLVAVAGDGR